MSGSVNMQRPVVTAAQAGALIKGAHYAEAITLITQALTHEPRDVVMRYLLGTALYRSGDSKGALGAFEATIRTDPSHAYAHYGLGLLYKEANDRTRADSHFRAALAADPQLVAARTQLAELRDYASSPVTQHGTTPAADGQRGAAAAPEAIAHMQAQTLAELLDLRGRQRPDEETVAGALIWNGRPAVRALTGSLLLALVLIVLPTFLADTAQGMSPSLARDGVAAMWRLAAAASWPGALVLVATGYVRVATRRYVIREHRVEIFSGILNRQHVSVWLHDVERPIVVGQNLWQLALGLGTVEVHSTVLPMPRGRRQAGHPGRLQMAGLPIEAAERVGGFLRTAVLWERRRMVMNFVSAR